MHTFFRWTKFNSQYRVTKPVPNQEGVYKFLLSGAVKILIDWVISASLVNCIRNLLSARCWAWPCTEVRCLLAFVVRRYFCGNQGFKKKA